MKNFIQKNWITALGLGLIFTAFLYFLKLALQNDWLPVEVRIALSFLAGINGLFAGHAQYNKGKKVLGEVLAGCGTAILYATIGYLSFSNGVNWSANALLISMTAISTTISAIAVRQNMRILFLISLCGGMLAPFVIRATEFLDVPLFIYLLVLNISALYASIAKGWVEMKTISFGLSLCLYAVYYSLFDPEQWVRPFLYVSCLFTVYAVGFLFSSWKRQSGYNGIDLYLGLVNGLNFIFWSNFIFNEFSLPHAIPLLIVGVLFLAISVFIFFNSKRQVSMALGAYSILGVVVLGVAGSEFGMLFQEGGFNYSITAGIWLVIVGLVYYAGRALKERVITYVSMAAHLLLMLFWYNVAWDVEWVTILGIPYIPFLNFGALIWTGLAFLGFSFSKYIERDPIHSLILLNRDAAQLVALISHILIGGLLTIQILNLWEAYSLPSSILGLAMSVCWFIYALILFLWGASSRQRFFKWLGSFVLFVSTAKVFFWDLERNSSIEQIIFLLVIGGITLLIGRGNKRHATPESLNAAKEEESSEMRSSTE